MWSTAARVSKQNSVVKYGRDEPIFFFDICLSTYVRGFFWLSLDGRVYMSDLEQK